MPDTLIERALRTATDTQAIEIGRGVVVRTGDVFARLYPGRTARIVADENLAGGRRPGGELADRGRCRAGRALTEANLIDRLVDELFAPGGYWAERS